MRTRVRALAVIVVLLSASPASAQGRSVLPPVPTPADVKPGNTHLILQHEKIERVSVVGHSMGGTPVVSQSTRTSLSRYVAHNPKAWNHDFETYTRIRYSWTLGAEWPRLAMAQSLITQMLYNDPVIYDWAYIQERMQFLAKRIPNGNGRVLLVPGLGHVPHLEAPEKVVPPLVSFLKENAK